MSAFYLGFLEELIHFIVLDPFFQNLPHMGSIHNNLSETMNFVLTRDHLHK